MGGCTEPRTVIRKSPRRLSNLVKLHPQEVDVAKQCACVMSL